MQHAKRQVLIANQLKHLPFFPIDAHRHEDRLKKGIYPFGAPLASNLSL